MSIKLDPEGLPDVPGVQWAIFSEDPVQLLKEKVKPGDSPAMIAAAWDLLFKRVTGYEVAFLSSNPEASAGVMANTAGGKKWLVSKAVWSQGKAYCWSVPFETCLQGLHIQLDSMNALSTDKLIRK